VKPPAFDAQQTAAAAVAAFDTDQNGALSKDELQQCPGLLKAIAAYDTDGDGGVTAAEIGHRIEQWQRTGKGLTPVSCFVLLDGQPLADADVVFEPASYLTDHLKPAFGTTRKDGRVALSLAENEMPADLKRFHYKGMQVGVYTVRVTHPQRSIPVRYNTESVLGEEISPRTTNVVVRLKSS
jgi:hypothetical protein